jgi:tRNA-specific 2-thiouridylase
VRCNTFTKFRDLLHRADGIDAEYIATGHYARLRDGFLYRGRDRSKDQSYFLWGIDRSVLPRMLLPVGDLEKQETRARARDMGLDLIANKEESQEICFVPDGNYVKVLERHLGSDAPALREGPFLRTNGTRVGTHSGFARYTVGQRRGLPGGHSRPLFVIAIDPARRAVVIGEREELLGNGLTARGMNWLGEAPVLGARLLAQVRHRAAPAVAEVIHIDDDSVELALQEPVAAIAPGQSLVLYVEERVVGGGFIEVATTGRVALPVVSAH